MPSLEQLRPYFTPGQLQDHDDRLRRAQEKNKTRIVRSLLDSGALPAVPDVGSVSEQLVRAVTLVVPTCELLLDIADTDSGLAFRSDHQVGHAVSLYALSLLLQEADPGLLPALVSFLELHSARLLPLGGPVLADGIAEYLCGADFLLEQLVEDELLPEEATAEEAIAYARENGHNHPEMVRDAYPAAYFLAPPSAESLAGQLEALRTHDHLALRTLAEIAPLLSPLVCAARLLPDMEHQEYEDVSCVPAPAYLYTISDKPMCPVYEVVDLHVRHVWESGDDDSLVSIHVDESRASHERLLSALQAQEQGVPVVLKIHALMEAAAEACEPPAVQS